LRARPGQKVTPEQGTIERAEAASSDESSGAMPRADGQ
jgi:hypothetical protein